MKTQDNPEQWPQPTYNIPVELPPPGQLPKPKAHSKPLALSLAFAQGVAFFFGVYSALSLYATVFGGEYNANTWWIDLSRIPWLSSGVWQLLVTAALLLFAVHLPRKLYWRVTTAALFTVFALAALANMLEVIGIARAGTIYLSFPMPFSFFIMIAFLLLAIAAFVGRPPEPEKLKPDVQDLPPFTVPERPASHRLAAFATAALAVLLCGIAFPLGQIACFGMTDYRSEVDAVVVLGARVYPSGTLSPALAGRVDKGIELYNQGYTPVLIMSGGIDADGMNEAEAMCRYAVERGVPEEAIIVDEYGNSTELTVANTIRIAEQYGFQRVAAVSSFYHMPRIKMLFLDSGMDVLTVPSYGDREGASLVQSTLREVPGWWYYWFRYAILGG